MEVGLRPGDVGLDGDPAPLLKGRWRPGAESHQFSAHGYCDRTAEWIKLALGMEVGLGPVHIVLDGDIAPLPETGVEPPKFSANLYCGQTAGCIKMPLGTEIGLGLRDIVLDVDPATSRKRDTHSTPPNFWPMSIVAKWLDG